MPNQQKPIIFFRELVTNLLTEIRYAGRTAYVGTGLLALAAALTLIVVTGLKEQSVQFIPTQAMPKSELKASMPIPQLPVQQAATPAPSQETKQPEGVPAKQPVTETQHKAKTEQQSVPNVPKPQRDEQLRWPLAGQITVPFGWQQHQVYKDWRFHTGIDMAADKGAPVKAALGGKVTEVYKDKKYGLTVVTTGGSYTVYYGSLAAASVNPGEVVETGTTIGIAGESDSEPYPHLHFAVKKGDNYTDPLELLKK